MIRVTAAALCFATLVSTTSGQEIACPGGSSAEPLTAFRWEYFIRPDGQPQISISVQNNIANQVRMVDGSVYFRDGLGRMIGDQPLPIDPDLQIFAGKANSFNADAPAGYERLAMAEEEDYEPLVCTRAILFKDGTKVEF